MAIVLTKKDVQEMVSASVGEVDAKVGDLSARLSDVKGGLESLGEQVAQQATATAETNELLRKMLESRQPPAYAKNDTQRPSDMEGTPDPTRQFADGDGVDLELVRGTMNDTANIELVELEQFMNEKVKIKIHTSSDENAQNIFEASVNGRSFLLYRGGEFVVPRYIVELLARCKPIHYKNVEFVDPADGIRKVRYDGNTGLRFQFDVIGDSNRGRHWLAEISRQP